MTDVRPVRLLAEADLPAYKALRDQMLAAHPEAFTSDALTELRRDAQSYRSRLAGASHGSCLFTLVVPRAGQLVGAISCEREQRSKVRHTAHIAGMMVLPAVQGHGIGRLLLESALALLERQEGIEIVTLSVTRTNARAVSLYESVGFTRYGRLEGAIKLADGSLLDKDLMSRRIG
ncbi:MAG: GNAT family N-acetyltransferase [Paucibacter sp.]|nr:GNAT family N-acetyltransferase [Roseateles sp.]